MSAEASSDITPGHGPRPHATPETSDAVGEWTVVHGWVQPLDEAPINLAALTAWLRGRVIASVSATAPGEGEAVTLGLVVADTGDGDVVVATQSPDGPAPSLRLQHFADTLVAEFDVALTIGDVWASGREDDEHEDLEDAEVDVADDDEHADDEDDWLVEHPLVIVSKAPESVLPLLARDLDAQLTAVHVDGWTLALAHRDYVFLEHHSWLRSELPAAALGRSGERRYVAVLATSLQSEEFGLVRFDDLIPVLDPIGLAADVAAALVVPHLAESSAVRRLCATRPFAHVAPDELAAVLQSPMDARWSSRVLACLGFPLAAAELAEERSVPGPDAVIIEPRGFWAATGEVLERYYAAPAHEVAARTPYGRAYAAAVSTPASVVATIVLELVAAGFSFRAADSATGWRATALRALGVTLVSDVAGHAVLAPRKFLRR